MDSTNDNAVRVTLGDFEIHEELGRGGMGVVYRARQISLNRIVALKVLKGSFTLLPTAVERFRREAAAAARLNHSSIVPIYATGSSEDQHFYAMELIEGFSLDKVLDQIQTTRQTRVLAAKRAPLTEEDKLESLDETEVEGITDQEAPVTEGHDSIHTTSSLSGGRHYYDSVARIIADAADALDYAHGRGVIHRDIKPGNLILSNANRIYITDFGLARVQEEQGLTVTGGVMGSPHYMSPEQVDPGHEDLDHRTDIYSLGVTLYELITLQAPFKGVSKELVMNHILTKEPKSPRKLSKRVPHDLETICLKAMDKRPDRRYQKGSELADDLRRYVNRFAITARRVGPVERALRWSQRHPSSAGLIIASIVAVIALSGLGAYKSYSGELERANEQAREYIIEAGKQRRVAEAASAAADIDRATAESERAAAVNAKAEAEDQKNFGQYVVNITRASHALEVEDGPKAERLLEQISYDPGQREMMGFEWGYLWNQSEEWRGQNVTPLSWQDPPWPLSGCSFSPGGEFLAVSGHYGRIMLIDGMNHPGNWDFHKVITLATVKSDEWKYAWVNQVSFSPNGRFLAASSDDHTTRIWEMADIRAWNRGDVPLEAAATLTGHEGSVYDIAFSKDGSQMASGSRDGTVKIWNIETPRQKALMATLTGHTGAVRSVAFSPAGNGLLASAADDGIIITWKQTGEIFKETRRTRPNDHPVMSVAFSPDGRTIASGGLDSAIRLWNSEDLREIVPLNGHQSGVIHVTFSPDGKWIASTGMDQTVQVWDFKRRAHSRTLQGHFGKVWRSVFSPDSKGLVSVGNDGSVKVWNLTEAVEVADRGQLTIENGSIWSSRISPDGKMIADIEGEGLGFAEIKIRLWKNVDVDAGSGQSRELDAWTGEVKGSWMACDFSPDSTQLVYCKGGNISLWNLVSGKQSESWKASAQPLVGARFNPTNGRQVAVWGKDRFVRLFDTVSQTETTNFPAAGAEVDGVRRVEFFPDGKSLATLEWNKPKVLLWDVESGAPIGVLTSGGRTAATCLAVSPDSSRLAVGNWKGQITIWNARTREIEATFSDGHRGPVNTMAFLDDGRTLVSAAADSTIRFWNLKMLKEVVSMNVVPAKGVLNSSGINDISTAARGSKLISAAGEPRIKIWTSAE